MSLIFFDGLQDAVLMPKPEYVTSSPWAGVTTGRDGSTNGAVLGGGGGAGTRTLILPSAAATCVAGYGFQLGTSGLGNTGDYVGFCSSLGTVQVVLFINSSGFIEVRRTNATGTLLGTSTGHAPVTSSTWHHMAAKVVLNSSSAGSVVVKLDDVQVLSVTSATTSSVTGSVTHLIFQSGIGVSVVIVDDIYVCDTVDATATQGRPNNDFLGDLRVSTLFPNVAGDTTQWTPSTGANWTTVDETPPNTTDFVSTTTAGLRDLYNMTDPTGAVTTVYGVRTGYYATKSDAGPPLLKPVVKENSVVTVESGQGLTFGSWTPIYSLQRFVRPSDSAVWTVTDLTNLQVGQDLG